MAEPMTDERLEWLHQIMASGPERIAPLEDELFEEIDRQAAEIEAFRRAVREDDGPSCDDVCQRACIGVCGAGVEVDGDVD